MMGGCFFVDLLAIFRRWFYVVGVQIISSHIVHETNQEEEIKKWLSLNRARNTNVVNKAHNRHQNNFPKSSYLGVALAHTMRGGERAHFAILSLHFLPSFLPVGRSLPISSSSSVSSSAMSQQFMQKVVFLLGSGSCSVGGDTHSLFNLLIPPSGDLGDL